MDRYAESKRPNTTASTSSAPTTTTTASTIKTYIPPHPAITTSTPRPSSYMTDEEKERLSREGRCFFCKEHGHLSRDCELKKKSRPAKVQEIAEIADSGKE